MSRSVQEILDSLNNKEAQLQQRLQNKLKNNEEFTFEDAQNYKLTEDDEKMAELFNSIIKGENTNGFNLQDFLGTPQAKVLVPKVVVGTMKRAADPVYLASKFYKK